MLDIIARYKRLIKSFHVSLYEQEGEMLRFKAQVTFGLGPNFAQLDGETKKVQFQKVRNKVCRWGTCMV